MSKLRDDYEDAFRNWAGSVDGLHVARETPTDDAAVSQAESDEEDAHRHYQMSRDRLVAEFLNPAPLKPE